MGPLDGIRVLDLSKYGPCRYCSMILGDLGAEVINIEAPRSSGQMSELMRGYAEALYIGHNRNKKSIAVDLKKEEGKSIFYELARKCDILVEPNRPGVLKKRSMDYETVSKINPRIIYCSVTGFGQDGPYADRSGHEITFSGFAGILGLTGSKNGPPVYLQSPSISDILGGVTQAVIAITAALYAREKIGHGQYIDVSITDGAAFYHWIDASQYLLNGTVPERSSSPTGSDMACMNIYRAGDGRYFTIASFEPWVWADLCRLIGREDFTQLQFGPPDTQEELYRGLTEIFAARPRDEWVSMLSDAGVCAGPVYSVEEMFSDPHFKHRKILVDVDHPEHGRIKLLNSPFKFSATPAGVRTRPPLWAEHTTEILGGLLGYSSEKLNELREGAVIE
ncbi:MAG: CoA transferase [Dehalococcoidia bacterium]|nr:CoA transferase [Dehalococcoidia bacterium]